MTIPPEVLDAGFRPDYESEPFTIEDLHERLTTLERQLADFQALLGAALIEETQPRPERPPYREGVKVRDGLQATRGGVVPDVRR